MSGLADSLVARLLKQRDLLQAMNEECRSISVTVASADQAVKVQVNGVGAMTGLWLSRRATQIPATELAKLIVNTAKAAAQHALERQRYLGERFDERFGDLTREPLTRWDGTTFVPGEG